MNLDFIRILLGLTSSHGLDIFKHFKPEYNYKKRDLFYPDREKTLENTRKRNISRKKISRKFAIS